MIVVVTVLCILVVCVCVWVCMCVRTRVCVYKCVMYIIITSLLHSGYAGRTELPDNLKSMFRPISMIVPDSGLIAEIILFGEGFSQTRVNKQHDKSHFAYICLLLIFFK